MKKHITAVAAVAGSLLLAPTSPGLVRLLQQQRRAGLSGLIFRGVRDQWDSQSECCHETHHARRAIVIVMAAISVVPAAARGAHVGGVSVSTIRGPRPHAMGTTWGNLYYVVHGDTLFSIGQRFGLYWPVIAQANGISSPPSTQAGQCLIIPGLARCRRGRSRRHLIRPRLGRPHPSRRRSRRLRRSRPRRSRRLSASIVRCRARCCPRRLSSAAGAATSSRATWWCERSMRSASCWPRKRRCSRGQMSARAAKAPGRCN